jgi:uncharacterized membrane protein
MVDGETLVESRLAHVVAVVLGAVGVAALLVGAASISAFWFWLFYALVWFSFLELFEEESGLLDRLLAEVGVTESESESGREAVDDPEREPEDALAVLRRRYAEGRIDDDEFEARLERLLDAPGSAAELETERY